MAEELTLQTRKGPLSALAFGPGHGFPVLALHGWLDNAHSFLPMSPFFPDAARVVALELPGHGASGHRPAGHRYELVEYVEDVMAAVDELGWYRFSVIGHSLGAVVAGLMAGTFPERVSAMVWIDAIGPYVAPDHDAPAILRRAIEQRQKPRREGRVFPALDEAIAARMQGFSPLARESARLLVERSVEGVGGGYRWRTDPRLRDPSMQRLNEAQVRAFLGRVVCPTLLISGSEGLSLALGKDSPRPGYMKQLEQLTLAGGHHLHMEGAAEAVAAAAFGFLRRQGVLDGEER